MQRSPFANMVALVADEDLFTLNLMQQVLSAFETGQVHAVKDIDSAKEILRAETVDFVLCDWMPAERNPLGLVKYIRTNKRCKNNKLPIVLYTGMTELKKIIEARDSGVNEIMAKPISPGRVMTKLQSALFDKRIFVAHDNYTGPDRRHKQVAMKGSDRRGKYGLDQDQIDSVVHEK
jgi:two-component system, chemotaxis family, chemotaxis protein CheY